MTFQRFFHTHTKKFRINQILNIDWREIKAAPKVKYLRMEIDDELNFNRHINKISKSALSPLKILMITKHV